MKMKQHEFIVMVGGKSGVGKTSLVDALIRRYPTTYARPVSYTSRPRRALEGDGEYVFSTKEEMDRMREDGEFLNFDCVYGHYYAMATSSISKIILDGRIPIKEIHPSNHSKIKAVLASSISVLVKGHPNERYDRQGADNDYYKNIDESEFDIVFVNDMSISIEQNAYYLNQRLASYDKYKKRFPPTGEIDSKNQAGYSLIADEFTEEKRVTTHNFHMLSIDFFQGIINRFPKNEPSILEIGPGQGWLRKTCLWPSIKYDIVELTREMAGHNMADNTIIASVANMPIPSHTYDVVLSSLGDPYFYPAALCEICRVLKPGGLFAFSLPSDQWARALRGDADETTTFISESGQAAQTYSFVFPREELENLLIDCGFEIIQLDSLKGSVITKTKEPISPALTKAAENCGVSLEALDIVTVCLCKKRTVQHEQ